MFVDFFIRRPVFATVCALLIILAGSAVIPTLPIAQFPTLAPPQVSVTSVYVGASAQTVETAVTVPLEQQINGAEGMKYITSTSSSNGVSTITATFDLNRDPDLAAVDIQNRVNTAQGRLPNAVKATGITIVKASSNFVLGAAVFSPEGRYSPLFMSNYVDVYVKDSLKRVPGVADVIIFGERKYSMRLWLDPVRMASRGLTAVGRGQRAAGTERRRRRRTGRAAAHQSGAGIPDQRARHRSAYRGVPVRRHHSEDQRRRDAGSPERCGPGRARRRGLQFGPDVQRVRRRRHRRHPALQRQRSRSGPPGAGGTGPVVHAFPAGHEVSECLRYHRGRGRIDPRRAYHADRSHRPGHPGHLYLSAGLAQHHHSGSDHPGFADRNFRLRQAAGIFRQYPDAVRHHPGHGTGGG